MSAISKEDMADTFERKSSWAGFIGRLIWSQHRQDSHARCLTQIAGPRTWMRGSGFSGETVIPYAEDAEGFRVFMECYRAGLAIEKAAIDGMNW